MSPLRIEVSGEDKVTLLSGERVLNSGVSVRVNGSRNEVIIPNIFHINFKSNSVVKVRSCDAVSSQVFLEKGEMELECDNKKVRIWAVDNLDIRIR